jgi:hypothetical protein
MQKASSIQTHSREKSTAYKRGIPVHTEEVQVWFHRTQLSGSIVACLVSGLGNTSVNPLLCH